MFARSRKTDVAETSDVSEAVARVLAKRHAARPEDDRPVRGPCAQAVETVQSALATLEAASACVRDAAAQVIEAVRADDARRAVLAERYDDARLGIDRALATAPEEARRLLAPGAERLSVRLTGATYAVAPFPLTTDQHGLDLPPPEHGFVSHAEVAETLRRVELAVERISRVRNVYQEDLSFLRARDD